MWAILVKIFWAVVTSFIVGLLTPRPKAKNAEPRNPTGIPTIEDDAIIPVLFGTRELKQNNVLWYGDLYAQPITKKSGGKK